MTDDYELMVVLKSDLSESSRENTIKEIRELIEGKKGKVESVGSWGVRDLAYTIKNQEKGAYFLINFNSDNKLPSFLNSKLRLQEELLRFLVVRKGD